MGTECLGQSWPRHPRSRLWGFFPPFCLKIGSSKFLIFFLFCANAFLGVCLDLYNGAYRKTRSVVLFYLLFICSILSLFYLIFYYLLFFGVNVLFNSPGIS